MKGSRSDPEGGGEADLTSELLMGHKNASGPIDGVGKPGVQHLLVIDSLSDLLGGAWMFLGPSTEQPHWEPQAQGATCCLTGERT